MIKLALQLAETGKIKIGGKGEERTSRNGGTYRLPVKFDHFEITTLDRDKNGDFIVDKEMMKHYPPQPKSLNIFFLFDDIDMVFPTQYALFSGSECKCSGDGVKANRKLKTGVMEEVDCDPDTCHFYQNKQCKIGGVLNCLISESQSVGGIYKLRTHSFHSVRNILSSLVLIRSMTNGILSDINFTLSISPKQVNVDGKTTTVHILNLEYKGLRKGLLDVVRSIKQERLSFNYDMKKIELKSEEIKDMSADEIKDITEEWYPESQKEPVITKEVIGDKEVEMINNSELQDTGVDGEDVPEEEVDAMLISMQKKADLIATELKMDKEKVVSVARIILGTDSIFDCTDPGKLSAFISYLGGLKKKANPEPEEVDEAAEKTKALIAQRKQAIAALYEDYGVPTGKQREANYEYLGTAELERSRTLSKLNTLYDYLVSLGSDDKREVVKDDEEEL